MKPTRTIIVDASPILCAIWHVQPDPDRCVEIFLNRLQRLRDFFLQRQNGTRLTFVCVFDPQEGWSWRNMLYPNYKAHRHTNESIRQAAAHAAKAVETSAHWIGLSTPAGFEADDLIATISTPAQKGQIVIVSPDKDLRQCLDVGRVVLMTSCRIDPETHEVTPEWYSAENLERDFGGLAPQRWVDWLALVGDSSDNVPGPDGIGPVAATKLLREHRGPCTTIDPSRHDWLNTRQVDGIREWLPNSSDFRSLLELQILTK